MPFLSTSEVAAQLGVTDETVRRWVAQKKIRHHRLPSGRVRFEQADVDAVLATIEAEGQASA